MLEIRKITVSFDEKDLMELENILCNFLHQRPKATQPNYYLSF